MRNNKVLAGVDMRDLDRLSDGANLNLVDEVIAFVRRAGGRQGSVVLFDIMDELIDLTGAGRSVVQDAFDIAYQDHRIQIDKDGFVKLVNQGKRRSGALHQTNRVGHKDALKELVARLRVPAWVQDPKIWAKAVEENDPKGSAFWGGVILSYRRYGGRVIPIQSKTAEFQPRPFDVHPDVWTVSSDGFLMRDIKEIQSIIADGVEPEDLKVDLVESGFEAEEADKLIRDSLATRPLI